MASAGWTAADLPSQAGRIFIVAGANSGIGLPTARALAEAGAHVVLAALCGALVLVLLGCSSAGDDPSGGKSGSPRPSSASSVPMTLSGRIVFNRGDVGAGESSLYTMNLDGSDVTLLFERGANNARWAPDGSTISFFCCDDGMAAHFIDPDGENFREIAPLTPPLRSTAVSPGLRTGSACLARAMASVTPRGTGSTPFASPTAAA